MSGAITQLPPYDFMEFTRIILISLYFIDYGAKIALQGYF